METINTAGKNIQINVDDITVFYDDLGAGDIPIIFIHGFPFDKSSWQPQMEFLQKTHRVIAYDIRGFGKSSSGSEKLSIDMFADDLVKFMEELEIKKAILCGLSMGGYIVLNAVRRYPKKFKALILCDTQCIADSAEAKEKRNQAISHIIASGLKDFAEGFIKNIFCKETIDSKSEIVDKIKKIILSTSTLTVTATLKALADRQETCSSLSEISVPALILCGQDDVVTPMIQSEFLVQNISNATLQTINRAGHMSNLEQPDEFNKHLLNFISGLSA